MLISRQRTGWALAAVALCLLAAAVRARAADPEAEVRELLRELGAGDMFAPTAASLNQHIESRYPRMGEPEREALSRAIGQELNRDRMFEALVEELAAGHEPAACAEALQWFRSPFGRKVRNAERQAERHPEQLQAYLETLRKMPPVARRAELARRLDAATHTTEDAIRMAISLAETALLALRALAPEGQGPSDEQVATELRRARQQLESSLPERVFSVTLFMHRSLLLDEMESYLEFAESSAGQWLYTSLGAAVESVFREASPGFVETLASNLEAARQRR
jgi:hypothetical protein